MSSIFVEVLFYLTRRDAEILLKKLLREKRVEAVLQKLDRLTQDKAQITAPWTLEVVHSLFQIMKTVMDGEQIH